MLRCSDARAGPGGGSALSHAHSDSATPAVSMQTAPALILLAARPSLLLSAVHHGRRRSKMQPLVAVELVLRTCEARALHPAASSLPSRPRVPRLHVCCREHVPQGQWARGTGSVGDSVGEGRMRGEGA